MVDRLNRYFDTSALKQPSPFPFGNLGRTLPGVRGPANISFDLSLPKNIAIGERFHARLRGGAFHAFNHTNFVLPATALGNPALGTIPAAGAARIIRIGLKIN